MIKVWHISDVHLSMNDDMQPIKKMHERRWAIGSWTFTDYLEAIADFAKANISNDDITVITGDIVHDMSGRSVYNSLNWLRNTIPGHIVICRGNHDRDWQVGRMKQNINLPRFHLVGEGEITQLGQYTIGCYSDHSKKTDDMETLNEELVAFARKVIDQAAISDAKIPFMIGHYPVSIKTAEAIGALGIKAFMSGHVHCTAGNEPEAVNGVYWKWYDISAGLTDDKYFDQCFFSTGTVDVLRAKHKQPFKEIECLRQHLVANKEIDRHKAAAAKFFQCNANHVDRFHKQDPFNPHNYVSGLLCRQKGLMQGSLYITHVNGVNVKPQAIYGTPKLAYPYKDDNSREYKKFKPHKSLYFADKWNGMNVLFYRYFDTDNNMYVTAKSKGTPFLGDSEVGNFLSLTREALLTNTKIADKITELISYTDVQSISCELCGKKEPHLVKYDFDIDLKPLFVITTTGGIKPFIDTGRLVFDSIYFDAETLCRQNQEEDHAKNVQYRHANNLPHKYEYEHFAVEGKVLYLLDENNEVIDRTLYKIKPQDIEEVHWQTFNSDMQGRVKEAVKKIRAEGAQVTEDAIQTELDMGPKEWDKFGRAIMEFHKKDRVNNARMVVLVGLPGSGKSTIAKELEKHGYVRVNQDDLGSRNACKKLVAESLKNHKDVVIDRCNFDVMQRKSWLDMAKSFGITNIKAYTLDVDSDTCIKRASERTDHPTLSGVEESTRVINGIKDKLIEASLDEGFSSVKKYKDMTVEAITQDILEDQCDKKQ